MRKVVSIVIFYTIIILHLYSSEIVGLNSTGGGNSSSSGVTKGDKGKAGAGSTNKGFVDNRGKYSGKNQPGYLFKGYIDSSLLYSGKKDVMKLHLYCDHFLRELRGSDRAGLSGRFHEIEMLNIELKNNTVIFVDSLKPRERIVLKKQISRMFKGLNSIEKKNELIKLELSSDNISIEKIVTSTKSIMKEFELIERQYRAIDWILNKE